MITIEYLELRDTCSCGMKWFPVVEVFKEELLDDYIKRSLARYEQLHNKSHIECLVRRWWFENL